MTIKQLPFHETFKMLLTSDRPFPSFVLNASEEEKLKWKLETPHHLLQSLGPSYVSMIDDILVPTPSDLTIGEVISMIHQFLSTRPKLASKKIIWWTWDKSLPTPLQNKLLKLIEESGQEYLFLFWMFSATNLLPTFRSRTVQWKNIFGGPSSTQAPKDFPDLNDLSSFAQFQELWDKYNWNEKQLLDWISYHLLLGERQSTTPYLHLEKFGNLVEWVNRSSQWNNPLLERKYMLFQFLRPLIN
jgi:hypothetical protein